ncbi:MAG: energy-coupled thiamine transporter ThiT [Clostridia bacterium]|nr:energy-coupled thiamine transporter ThiT [Clostridia bacterium]
MKNRSYIKKLVVSAVMLALAFGLSYVKIFTLPFEGSITLFSMLPIIIVSIKFGIGWGLGTAFCYSWLQILQGGVFSWGLTPGMLAGSLLLDYIVAFTVLGLAGIFRKKGTAGIITGTVLACVLRFISHFVAGFVLWANYAEFVAFGATWVNHPVLYSLCYNGIYMLPETVMAVVGIVLLVKLPQVKALLKQE